MKTLARKASQHLPPPGTDPLADLLTAQEAALLAGVTQNAVLTAIREGRLRAWARAGVYLIPAAELAAWQPVRGRGKRRQSASSIPHPKE